MELDEQNPLPWIHEEDLPAAHRADRGLGIRVQDHRISSLPRGHDGHCHPLDVTLNLVLLDQHTDSRDVDHLGTRIRDSTQATRQPPATQHKALCAA